MNNLELQDRVLEQKDWAIFIFLFAFALIAIVKTNFENRYNDFLKLLISNKYLKTYKDGALLTSWFNIIFFIFHLISLAFFVQLILDYYKFVSKTDFIIFIRIFTLLLVFILSKLLIEKIIATVFEIEEQVDMYNMTKVSYRTNITLLLFPINAFLFYNNNVPILLIYCVVIIVLIINFFTYFKCMKLYQNAVNGYLIYYILYLCTLEIAPYYFVYYLFTS